MSDRASFPDGPEADLIEQRQEVDPGSAGTPDASRVTRDPEVPEADALEQAQDVPLPLDEDPLSHDEHDGYDVDDEA